MHESRPTSQQASSATAPSSIHGGKQTQGFVESPATSDKNGKHHAGLPGSTKHSAHHVRRRSFDSINTGELQGMNQNFVGGDAYRRNSVYPFTSTRRSSFYGVGKRGDRNDEMDEDPLSYLMSREQYSEDNVDKEPFGLDMYQSRIPVSADLDPVEKRGFDSISRWSGGVSGLSQNFVGPKRGDFNSFRRNPSRYVDSFFGNSLWQQSGSKRNFDSISNGPLNGLYQNHLSKKNNYTVHRWVPGGFRGDFILKRGSQELGDNIGTFEDAYRDIYDPPVQDKRSFDSISQGELSGIRQNHIGKRAFDSISTGSAFGTLGQNFVQKRRIDSLNSDPNFSNSYLNYKNKRDFEYDADTSKRFDSISTSSLDGMRQNFIQKRFPYSRYYSKDQDSDKTTLDPILISLLRGPFPHFVSRRSVESVDPAKSKQMKKRHFDSITKSSLGGMRQNFVSKKSSGFASRLRHILSNFPHKKSFDSVGFTRMGGMAQNFISKRILDSIHDGQIGGFNQNFIGKRNFDSIDTGHLSGIRQNFIGRKRFDSIGNTHFSGMGRNFVSKRYFDSINHNALGGMRQNFISKRHFDSLNSGPIGGFQQNFVSKRNFDSINNNKLHGMSQNFISKRLKYLAGKSRNKLQHTRENILRISDLMAQAEKEKETIDPATDDLTHDSSGTHHQNQVALAEPVDTPKSSHENNPNRDSMRMSQQDSEDMSSQNHAGTSISKDNHHR